MAEHDANDKSNSLNEPSANLDLFDQLQHEFDVSLSAEELPKPVYLLPAEDDALTDSAQQDTVVTSATVAERDATDQVPAAIKASESRDATDAGMPKTEAEQATMETDADTPATISEETAINDAETDHARVSLPDDHETEPFDNASGSDEPDDSDTPTIAAEQEETLAQAVMEETVIAETDIESNLPEPDPIADEAPSAPADAIEDGIPEHLDDDLLSGSDEEHEAVSEAATDSDVNKIFLKESDLSDSERNEQDKAWQPASDQHPSDLDGIDPFADDTGDTSFEEEVPVHADMSGEQEMQRRGSGRIIALASVIVVAVAGGVFWFTGTDQPAPSQQQASKADNGQSASMNASPINTAAKQQIPETTHAKTVTLKKPDSRQESEQAAATPQAETEKATMQRAAIEKAKAERLAAKQAVKKAAIIQPSTPIQKQAINPQQPLATVVDEPGNWVVDLASVNSDKSARQHVARIRAMGVESEAVQVNDKGRIFHHIRIAGFTSKLEAMKRRDALAKQLGVKGAKVEKL